MRCVQRLTHLAEDKFTESEFQSKWEREAEAAKAKIRTMTEEEDMQAEVDAFTDITNSIIAEQQLFVAKAGYVNILKKYHAGFSYETNAQKQFADDAMAAAIDKINAANTVDEAASALDAGKESIRRIGEQDADFVDELKESAKKKLNAQKESSRMRQQSYAMYTMLLLQDLMTARQQEILSHLQIQQ